ncbi:CAP domain-containing protein [Streptomyces sp. NPDC051211]|uniref:CAP domain-containing protein n=1 Tax=Streptomyces sp. NPDC051211 TaxID=3154643 RepID=UPI0034506D60
MTPGRPESSRSDLPTRSRSRIRSRRQRRVRVALAAGLLVGTAALGVAVAHDGGDRSPAAARPTPPADQGTQAATGTPEAGVTASVQQAPLASPSATTPNGTTSPSRTPATARPTEDARDQPSPRPTGTPSKSRPTATARPAGTKPAGGGTADSAEATVLTLVNQHRREAGCAPLTTDPDLVEAARAYSATMAKSGVMSHTGPDGSTMTTRVEAAGYSWSRLGENIAQGQRDARAVVDAWMKSPGHRANILNCGFTEIGVGVDRGAGGPWWTQNFGAPR